MKVDLKNLFNGSEERLDISTALRFDDLLYSTYHPIKDAVSVTGCVYAKADVVHLDLTVSFTFHGFCDRCAQEIERPMQFLVQKILVEKLQQETDADVYLVVKNNLLELDSLIEEEIILFLPSKILCKEDCLGLCYQCGQNLNEGTCNCKKDVDPRMEVLLQLLDEK